MANPTTNYGFVLPTSADLVTDLPADFDVALQGVDTRLKALQPGTTLGDLAYSSATANTNTRLPIGTAGQVLAVSGAGVPAWTTTADVTPLTTKGDLFTFTTVDARIGVGANGTVLTADSTEATGLKWATPASGGGVLGSLTITNGADYTTTSTSLVAVSTSNARVTVTTTSTKLIVLLTGWAENATGNSAWSVSVGAGTVYEQMVSNNSYETPNPNASSMHIITGLTANTSYNVDWMYRAISAGTAIIAGSNNTVYPRMVVLAG